MKTAKLWIILAGLTCAACGGGNGGGAESAQVGGVWRGAATLTRNTCNLALTFTTIQFTHNVNQNESAVTLDDENNVHYLGNVVGNDGFSVNAAPLATSFASRADCNLSRQVEYNDISGEQGDGNENSAEATFRFSGTCVGAQLGVCELDFAGTAVRGSGPVTTPTPGATATPTPGDTPVSGACSAVSQRSYAGDAACGIGTSAFDVTATGATLEPFGVNGVTTFTSPTVGATTLTTVRNDLTILGVPGYSCTMSCAPPLEFFVKCTKEGGTSCTEKF